VITADDSNLVAVVPPGATYRPITVITNGLTATAGFPFHPIFEGGKITDNSFEKILRISPGIVFPRGAATGDVDGDGKSDIVSVSTGTPNSKVSIFKNISSKNVIRFELALEINVQSLQHTRPLLCDLNGDGKLDIIAKIRDLSVFKNISTGGNLAFANEVRIPDIDNAIQIIMPADINGDGKIDIIGLHTFDSTMSVYRNTSTRDSISFANRLLFRTGRLPRYLCLQDMNADGRPEIIITHAQANLYIDPFLSVFENKSEGGRIILGPDPRFSAVPNYYIVSEDFDGDNRSDILTLSTGKLLIHQNTSTPGGPVTLAPQKAITTNLLSGMSIADFDGEGRADLALDIQNWPEYSKFSIMYNTSIADNIMFTTRKNYPLDIYGRTMLNDDFDNDGRPDVLFDYMDEQNLCILRNRMGEIYSVCSGDNLSFLTNIRGGSYQWQMNTDTGFINLISDTNFSGVNDSMLLLTHPPTSWYGRQFRCMVDNNPGITYDLTFVNKWTGALDTSWENPSNWSCGLVPDQYSDVEINTGNVTVNSLVTVRSLSTKPGAKITIRPPFNLTTLH